MRRLLAIDTRAGVTLALITAVISGVSVYLNKSAVQALPNPVVFTTLKNSLVGLALVLCLTSAWRPAGFRLTRRMALALGGLALFGGSLPFLLFFQGLATASAPSAALIHKSLILWVAQLAAGLLGERPGRWTFAGLILLAAGQLISGWPKMWGWASGESLILAATLLWTIETVLARRLLPNIPAAVGAAARMAGGAALMWAYLFASGQAAGAWALSPNQWGWLILTSTLLLGYVITWYAALKRAPAMIVTSVLTLGVVITAALAVIAAGQGLATKDVLGLAVIAAGVLLSLRPSRRSAHVQLAAA
jgi:drug/metabolite transporter (DMT)-like permease